MTDYKHILHLGSQDTLNHSWTHSGLSVEITREVFGNQI